MAGRPSSYMARYNEQARKLCLLGMTDKEIADFFGIDEGTLYDWQQQFPEFRQSMIDGKSAADSDVAEKLYHRALGYSHKAVKIFQYEGQPIIVPYTEYYPPDTQAASLWLRNRQPDKWRDRREVTGADGKDLMPERATDAERVAGAFLAALKTIKNDD